MSCIKLAHRFLLKYFYAVFLLLSIPVFGAVLPAGDTVSSTPVSLKSLVPGPSAVTLSGVAVSQMLMTAAADNIVTDASVGALTTTACLTSDQCGTSSYCAKPVGACSAIGICRARPDVCIASFDPVCGCDGKTYGNLCEAARAGVSVASLGACISSPPVVDGFWPGDAPAGRFVFVFGHNFVRGLTQVQVNGIPAPLVHVGDPTVLVFVLPAGDTNGPITVTTPFGSAKSSASFGVPFIGVQITGFWPSAAAPGRVVFVFGAGFVAGESKVAVNGVNALLVQVVDPGLLLFMVPLNATSGFITVTTPSGSATSTNVLTIGMP